MFLTDHTNCYFHGELLSPLATRLGLTLRPVTAADRGPERTLSPSTVAWIRVVPAPQDHPVLKGVSAFGFMTGGSATGDPAQGLAGAGDHLPGKGWADVLGRPTAATTAQASPAIPTRTPPPSPTRRCR
ncbi:MAG: hypothetical protein IPG17_30535 [Sandaracinaceae bacterium]|nr:hypothetical protein [Sandaracinaceae bacterium]